MARANELINRHGMKLIAITTTLLGAGLLWLLFSPVRVTVLNDIIVSTDPITAGRFERYTARDCHNEDVEGKITRNLVIASTDEAPITLGDVSQRPIKCSNIIFIPAALPSGEYELQLDICYPTNPIRDAFFEVCKYYRSEPFKVEGNPALAVPGMNGTETGDNIRDRIDIEAPPENRQGVKQPQGAAQPGQSSPPASGSGGTTPPQQLQEVPPPPVDIPPPVRDPLLCLPFNLLCL